ncbi:MAG: site-2 protease family protein [Defluviitaleaceae bacterium]|nr:site-2 protease family protein [Defluviitaleaceae bacterium]
MPTFNFELILLGLPGIIIAIGAHEWAKAVTIYKMGDTSVKAAGRLTLNPFKHIDMLGFFFFALLGYGWAKPVPIKPFAFADRRKALIAIFAVPFLVSMVLGVVFAVASSVWYSHIWQTQALTEFNVRILLMLELVAMANVTFALLNFIPIYPLDGSFLLAAIAPKASLKLAQVEKILQIVLAFAIIFGAVNWIVRPLANGFLGVLFR